MPDDQPQISQRNRISASCASTGVGVLSAGSGHDQQVASNNRCDVLKYLLVASPRCSGLLSLFPLSATQTETSRLPALGPALCSREHSTSHAWLHQFNMKSEMRSSTVPLALWIRTGRCCDLRSSNAWSEIWGSRTHTVCTHRTLPLVPLERNIVHFPWSVCTSSEAPGDWKQP